MLKANYPPISVPLTVDVTTGDMITPREVEYTFSLLFDNRTISILAYNLETVLAEKLETVLSRNIANTRPRDYYDVHILYALRGAECDKATLRRALERTTQKRGSGMILTDYPEIMKEIRESDVLAVANDITPEPIAMDESLNLLSGGQTRALMIADIALICDSPIVLVDEIENAGIDKQRALSLLQSREKLVLVVTHDPHTALMAERRLVMSGGAVKAVITRSEREAALYDHLSIEYARSQRLQTLLRKGELLA